MIRTLEANKTIVAGVFKLLAYSPSINNIREQHPLLIAERDSLGFALTIYRVNSFTDLTWTGAYHLFLKH